MKRSIRAAFLTLLVAASITVSAHAAPLFPSKAVYRDQFVDVRSTDWFYDNVAALYEMGLTNGQGDSAHFAPHSDMTVAEVLTMAARLRSLYDFGNSEAGAGFFQTEDAIWYAPYVAYLKYTRVIGNELDHRLPFPATRAEVAHILANALPDEIFEDINADVVTVGYAMGRYIRDVNDYTPYRGEILSLYRRGIVNGVDSIGSYDPYSMISRSEVAAMVTRMVDDELRVTLRWTLYEESPVTSLSDLVFSDGEFYIAPRAWDTAAIDADIRYMLSRGERTLSLDYTAPLTDREMAEVMEAFLTAIRRYPEQTYNQVHVSYSRLNGKVTILFSSSLYSEAKLSVYREQILTSALAVREELYSKGILQVGMSQYEKAKVYFEWLCSHCEYDTDCGATGIGHSALGVFRDRRAVCDGYTAAYNLLLRLEGIECCAVDLEEWNHMWTAAVLDGTEYHIDVTWGDQTGTPIARYFAMSEEEAFSRFHA